MENDKSVIENWRWWNRLRPSDGGSQGTRPIIFGAITRKSRAQEFIKEFAVLSIPGRDDVLQASRHRTSFGSVKGYEKVGIQCDRPQRN